MAESRDGRKPLGTPDARTLRTELMKLRKGDGLTQAKIESSSLLRDFLGHGDPSEARKVLLRFIDYLGEDREVQALKNAMAIGVQAHSNLEDRRAYFGNPETVETWENKALARLIEKLLRPRRNFFGRYNFTVHNGITQDRVDTLQVGGFSEIDKEVVEFASTQRTFSLPAAVQGHTSESFPIYGLDLVCRFSGNLPSKLFKFAGVTLAELIAVENCEEVDFFDGTGEYHYRDGQTEYPAQLQIHNNEAGDYWEKRLLGQGAAYFGFAWLMPSDRTITRSPDS